MEEKSKKRPQHLNLKKGNYLEAGILLREIAFKTITAVKMITQYLMILVLLLDEIKNRGKAEIGLFHMQCS